MAKMTQAAYSAEEFDREARRIESLVWGATGISEGESVLLCGMPTDESIPRRIGELGAKLTVIDSRDEGIRRAESEKIKVIRGSTSVIPARDHSFSVTLAFHYLHEVDPFFHQQIVSELSRVGKRVAIVELGPPADLLGRRIAMLYSRAKRERGQFEYYQPFDYWKKLLSVVKAEVSQSVFAFTKVPPREYLQQTIDLLLDTMEVEEAPPEYMDELRAIAEEPSAKLLPQARYVIAGAAAGELPKRKAAIFADTDTGTAFAATAAAARQQPLQPETEPEPQHVAKTEWISAEPAEPEEAALEPVAEFGPAPVAESIPEHVAPPTPPPTPPPQATPFAYPEIDQDDGIPAPPSFAAVEAATPSGFGHAFDDALSPLPEPPGFGLPQIPPVSAPGTGWQWEPPEDEEPEEKP
ncbi:MAG TPA: hypothetical protein VN905_08920 [Candidatus Binatia bacterium]|nr:hypothetical protein [Candidatus Binatia bacterium]